MFIDKRLEEAIIREFSFRNMTYKGIFKDLSRNPLLIFTGDHGRCLAIYRKSDRLIKFIMFILILFLKHMLEAILMKLIYIYKNVAW